MTRRLAPIAALLFSFSVFAHEGHEHELAASEVMRWWTVDPLVLVLLIISSVLYALGVRAVWARAGRGKGIRGFEVGCFVAGQLSVIAALISPLDHLSDLLFSAHMTQHELLMLVSAPLLVFGKPLVAFLWAFPSDQREKIGAFIQRPAVSKSWRLLTGPLFVVLAHGIAVWIWHIPALFQAALRNDAIHAVQHAMFFITAALFFWALVHGRYGRVGYGLAVFYVFFTGLHTGLLGALITFARSVWYPDYTGPSEGIGHSALADQQLAGVIMWVPAGTIFILIGLALFAAWMGESERRQGHTSVADLVKLGANKSVLLLLLVPLLSLGGGCKKGQSAKETGGLTGGDPSRGKDHLKNFGCGTCHIIPGVPNANGTVGPNLTGIGARSYLAGQKENSVPNLLQWIQHPRKQVPGTAMPDVGVNEEQARDIAAYLYTLKD
ncbi:MAG: cytochrome c oxidase assembly protein [Myxococcaceae bacterium]